MRLPTTPSGHSGSRFGPGRIGAGATPSRRIASRAHQRAGAELEAAFRHGVAEQGLLLGEELDRLLVVEPFHRRDGRGKKLFQHL